MRRFVVGALATVGLVLASTGTASAWWAEGTSIRGGSQGIVEVHTAPGEQLDLSARKLHLSLSAVDATRGVILRDSSTPVTDPPAGGGAGCVKLDDFTLSCHGIGMFGDTAPVGYLDLVLGDGDDRVHIPATSDELFTIGDMAGGNDTLEVDNLAGAALSLGDGDDRATLRGSNGGFLPTDTVWSGPGDDVLRVVNLSTDDNPNCGDGNDTLYADAGEADTDCETVHTFP